MSGTFSDVKATGNYVVLKFESVERELFRKQGKIFVPNSNEKETYKPTIYSIGPEVKDPSFKIGDEVVFNQYDMNKFGDDTGQIYGVVQAHNIMAVLETK